MQARNQVVARRSRLRAEKEMRDEKFGDDNHTCVNLAFQY